MSASATHTSSAQTTNATASASSPLPRRSARLFSAFRWYARRYVARRFHGVWLARDGSGDGLALDGPVVVVLNHPSWWDPLIGFVLSDLFPGRLHSAPIDSAALAKYQFFERLGFFGIDPGSPRGAREFLRRSQAILAADDAMLWVTAQGHFADVRDRPVRLKEGVGHLACRLRRGWILPLALEYAFWEESTPEAFGRFGSPIALGRDASGLSATAWTQRIAEALGMAQDALAADVQSRDPTRFRPLIQGRDGVGGFYDLWRRVRSAARGERFVAGHGGRVGPDPS